MQYKLDLLIKKTIPLILLVFFIHLSCQKEDLVLHTGLDDKGNSSEINVQTLYSEDVINIPLLKKELLKDSMQQSLMAVKQLYVPKRTTFSSTEINISQFEIDYSLAKQITYNSIITYTFQLYDINNLLGGKLINLVFIKYPDQDNLYSNIVIYHNDGHNNTTINNGLDLEISAHSILESGEIYPPLSSEEYPITTYRIIDGGTLQEVVISYLQPPSGIIYDWSDWDMPPLDDIPGSGDGGGGGGGGPKNDSDIPTTPVITTNDPCETANIAYSSPYLADELKDLHEKRNDSIEHGFTFDKNRRIHPGTNGTATSLNIKTSTKTVGIYHTHPSGGIFSIADFFNFINVLLKTETSLNNVTSTVLTNSTYNYMLTFDGDEELFKSLFSNGNPPFKDRNEFNRESTKELYDYYKSEGLNIDTSFLHIIENNILNSNNFTLEDLGIKVVRFKLSEDGSEITYSEEINLSPYGKLERKRC